MLRVGVVVPGDVNVCDLGAVDVDGPTGVANVGFKGGEVCVGVHGGEVVSEEYLGACHDGGEGLGFAMLWVCDV